MLCKDCISGRIQTGTPVGTEIVLEGQHKAYGSIPNSNSKQDCAILVLTDIFGLALVNNKLLCDHFAARGFRSIVPDYLNGDSVPVEALESGQFDIGQWFQNHGTNATRPAVDATIRKLKSEGITKIAAVGYCFGARTAFDLAFDGAVKCVVVSHPSLLQVPSDLEQFKKTGVPLLMNTAEYDDMFGKQQQDAADDVFKGVQTFKHVRYDGQKHGFAVRGDFRIDQNKQAMDRAFEETVEWLNLHA